MVVLTSFQMPETPVKYEQRNTRAVLDKKDLGLGTLYISERLSLNHQKCTRKQLIINRSLL